MRVPSPVVSGILRPLLLATAAGALCGLATRPFDVSGPLRSAAAVAVVLAACACFGAWITPVKGPLGSRLSTATLLAGGAWCAASAAILVAGGAPTVLLAAFVPAAVVLLSHGVATALRVWLRVWGSGDGFARTVAAAAPLVAFGGVFLADPFVEWSGQGPASARVASWVVAVNPFAAVCSPVGGLGVPWLTMPLLYDGPGGAGDGLSVIGQYYPGPFPHPLTWSAVAAALGLALIGVAGASGRLRAGGSSLSESSRGAGRGP